MTKKAENPGVIDPNLDALLQRVDILLPLIVAAAERTGKGRMDPTVLALARKAEAEAEAACAKTEYEVKVRGEILGLVERLSANDLTSLEFKTRAQALMTLLSLG